MLTQPIVFLTSSYKNIAVNPGECTMLKILSFLCGLLLSTYTLADDSVMKVVPLANRLASELQPLISPFLESSERIVANHSSLIVKAPPDRQKEIKKLIDQLDSPQNNLIITVLQSKTESAQSLNTAANIRINTAIGRQSNLPSRFQGRFATTETSGHLNNQQQVQTLDGKPAYIKIGKIHPVQNLNIQPSGYGYPVISSNTQLIEASTGFRVIPHLSGQKVTLEVIPWSSTMNNNSIINTQSAHTTVTTRLGQWVEIGGVDQLNKHTMDGSLSHAYTTSNKNMKILVKVTIKH